MRNEPVSAMRKVWIVLQDATPTNTVLGVFATSDEAFAFAEDPEVKRDHGDSVIYSSFPIGYRYNANRQEY